MSFGIYRIFLSVGLVAGFGTGIESADGEETAVTALVTKTLKAAAGKAFAVTIAKAPEAVAVAGPVKAKASEPSTVEVRLVERPGEKVAYMGVVATKVPEALAAQLDLPKDMGLLVQSVQRDSPAAAAGLQKHDVLRMLNDQILVSTEQLRILMQSMKAGDEIDLTVMRKAETIHVTTKLSEKATTSEHLFISLFESKPSQSANVRGFNVSLPEESVPKAYYLFNSGAGNRLWQGAAVGVLASESNYTDEEHVLKIVRRKYLVAMDRKTNQVAFEGPIDTAEERKAVPDELRVKLEQLEASTRKSTRTYGVSRGSSSTSGRAGVAGDDDKGGQGGGRRGTKPSSVKEE